MFDLHAILPSLDYNSISDHDNPLLSDYIFRCRSILTSAPRAHQKHNWFSPFSLPPRLGPEGVHPFLPSRPLMSEYLQAQQVGFAFLAMAMGPWWLTMYRYSTCHPMDLLLSCPVSCIGQAFPLFVHEAKETK